MISKKLINGVDQGTSKVSFTEQTKQASLDTRFGTAPSGVWGDSFLVKSWTGGFTGGTLTTDMLQVQTTDENVTRMISKKLINGVDQGTSKVSFTEQTKQASLDTRFGSAPSGVWGDSFLVKSWTGGFTSDTLTPDMLQVQSTDENVTRMISKKLINGVDQGTSKVSFTEQTKQASLDTRFGTAPSGERGRA